MSVFRKSVLTNLVYATEAYFPSGVCVEQTRAKTRENNGLTLNRNMWNAVFVVVVVVVIIFMHLSNHFGSDDVEGLVCFVLT